MELRYLTPDLESLDSAGDELVIVSVFEDRRPPAGVAGLIDWRSAGRISALLENGFFGGQLGEVLMIPGKPFLPTEKLLLFGAGATAQLDEGVFSGLLDRILQAVEGLCIRSVVIQLPGREHELITPERAADLLLTAAKDNSSHDVWTLLEPTAAQQRITARRSAQQRRHPDDSQRNDLLF